VTETDAENGDGGGGLRNQVEADASLFGRARSGRQHDGIRIGGDYGAACHLVVAMHLDLRPQFTEIVDQVEGEAVIIIDQDDHRIKTVAPKTPCPRGS
jgi:hypothetical protein